MTHNYVVGRSTYEMTVRRTRCVLHLSSCRWREDHFKNTDLILCSMFVCLPSVCLSGWVFMGYLTQFHFLLALAGLSAALDRLFVGHVLGFVYLAS